MPHTPMTCNPQRTTKTASVLNNAIRSPMDKQDSQCLSMLIPESLFFKFFRATRLSSKCFTQEPTKTFLP